MTYFLALNAVIYGFILATLLALNWDNRPTPHPKTIMQKGYLRVGVALVGMLAWNLGLLIHRLLA